jgi:hypothetical protein
MKTSTTVKSLALIAFVGAAFATPLLAQPGPGWGMMGGGMGMGGMGMGGGPGMRFAQNNTGVWSLMTPEERIANQNKMRAVKTYDECKLLQTEQRTLMEARAKEKGVTLPTPRQDGCDNMKARGFIK